MRDRARRDRARRDRAMSKWIQTCRRTDRMGAEGVMRQGGGEERRERRGGGGGGCGEGGEGCFKLIYVRP